MHPLHISRKAKTLISFAAALLLCASCGLSYQTAPVAVKQPVTASKSNSDTEPKKQDLSASSAPESHDVSSDSSGDAASSTEPDPSSMMEQQSGGENSADTSLYLNAENPAEISEAPQFDASEKAGTPEGESSAAGQPADPSYEKADPETEIALMAWAGTSVWPLPGYTERSAGYSDKHSGMDLTGDDVKGAGIVAFRDGTVLEAEYNDSWGNYVRIGHGSGLVSLYAHCQSLLVGAGDTVTAGQAIATVGSSGKSTGPHLHFELQQDGDAVDPEPYLK